MRAPRPAYLPLSLSLCLERFKRVVSPCRLPHTAFATLIKRSGLCHTWHAADNSRASVQLRLRPAWSVSCILPPGWVCLLPAASCILHPASCDLCTKQRCVCLVSPRRAPRPVALLVQKMQRSALCRCHGCCCCCCGGMFGMWQPREMRTEHATCSKCHKNIDTSFTRPARWR